MASAWLALGLFGSALALPLVDLLPITPKEGPKMMAGAGSNFPDPSIVHYNNQWYSFATRTLGANPRINVPVAISPDFHSWDVFNSTTGAQFDALPSLPSWVPANVADTKVWAPDVNQLDDGSWIMYYSALHVNDTTKHCVGAARSKTSVTGP